MLTPVTSLRSFLACCTILLACDRTAAPAKPPTETPTIKPSDEPHDRTKSFHALEKQAKMDRMVAVVMPDMGAVFRAYDEKRYAGFDCSTCHVNHAHHPKDGLPKIVLSNGGYEKLTAEKPELMKFMGEKVVPAMATAMGEPPFDPATGKGFGCGGCHTVE